MKQKKYFTRILLSLACICMIFSFVISAVYYMVAADNIDSEFLNVKRIDSVKYIENISADFSLCKKSAKTAAEQLILAENGLSDINSVFDVAEEIYSKGYIYITDESGVVYKKEESPVFSGSVFEQVRNMSESERLLIFVKDGERYLMLANRVKTDNGRGIYVIRAFAERDFLSGMELNAIVIFDENGEIYLGEDGKCSDLKAMINESGSERTVLELKKMGYKGKNMVYVPVEFEHIKNSIIIFSYDNSYAASLKEGNIFVSVAMFFIMFIVLTILSFIPAKIIYHPVDELVAFTSFYGKNVIKDDEISYISGVIKSMDEESKALYADAKEHKEIMKIQFIKDLLSGIMSETKYFEFEEEFKMTEYETPFYVGIFEISDYDSLAEAFDEKNLIQIKKQIGEFITDELAGRSVSHCVEIDKKRFAVITCGCDLIRIRQNFSYIISVINSEFDIEMFSAISSECDSLFETGEGYQMCSKAFEESLAVGFPSAVVVYDDIKVGAGFYYPVNLERDLISSVLRLKREESLKIINAILDENLNGKTLTKEKHNAIIFAFTATINRIVEALNKTVSEVFEEENIIFLELKMCTDAGALRSKIVQSFDKIMNYMAGDEDADLSQRFLDYIHSHYNEDISLTEIGAHFKLSECYLSTVFKETTGENFKEYLSRYRIKRAKEILTNNPDIKTKELAAMIGCNTVATLFRLFNKYEGMSPGQFVKDRVKTGSETHVSV